LVVNLYPCIDLPCRATPLHITLLDMNSTAMQISRCDDKKEAVTYIIVLGFVLYDRIDVHCHLFLLIKRHKLLPLMLTGITYNVWVPNQSNR